MSSSRKQGWHRWTTEGVENAEYVDEEGNVLRRYKRLVDGSWFGGKPDQWQGKAIDNGYDLFPDGEMSASGFKFWMAAGLRPQRLVEELGMLSRIPNPDQLTTLTPYLMTLLYRAPYPKHTDREARDNADDRLERLLMHCFANGGDPDEMEHLFLDTHRPLTLAACFVRNRPSLAQTLIRRILEAGANVNLSALRLGHIHVGAIVLHEVVDAMIKVFPSWDGAPAYVAKILQMLLEAGLDLANDDVAMVLGRWGDPELIDRMLASGGSVNAALYDAVWRGREAAVATLLDRGGDPNAYIGNEPIFFAAWTVEMLRQLESAGADLSMRTTSGFPYPYTTLTHEKLVAAGYPCPHLNAQGRDAIMEALEAELKRDTGSISYYSLNDLKTAIASGIPNDRPLNNRGELLIHAVLGGLKTGRQPPLEGVESLIRGLDLTSPSLEGIVHSVARAYVTCASNEPELGRLAGQDEAAWTQHNKYLDDLAALLCRHGLSVESPHGLVAAARMGSLELVNSALEADVDVNAGSTPHGQTTENTTPLITAVSHDRVDVVRRLLEAGADPNLGPGVRINRKGAPLPPPICWVKSTAVLQLLLDAGADLNVTFQGRTVLEHWWRNLWNLATNELPHGLPWDAAMVDVGVRLLELGVPPLDLSAKDNAKTFTAAQFKRLSNPKRSKSKKRPPQGALVPFLTALEEKQAQPTIAPTPIRDDMGEAGSATLVWGWVFEPEVVQDRFSALRSPLCLFGAGPTPASPKRVVGVEVGTSAGISAPWTYEELCTARDLAANAAAKLNGLTTPPSLLIVTQGLIRAELLKGQVGQEPETEPSAELTYCPATNGGHDEEHPNGGVVGVRVEGSLGELLPLQLSDASNADSDVILQRELGGLGAYHLVASYGN